MDIHILPHPFANPNSIHMPHRTMEEIDVISGQFLQLSSTKELVLKIQGPLEEDQRESYISTDNFEILQGLPLEFKVLDVTLGCDPEFFILWKNRLVSAATYLPYSGTIGADGQLGELRPMYAKHEDQVVDNLRNLIAKVPEKMRRKPWATGAPLQGHHFDLEGHSYHHGLAAGFHVHLGIPPEILNTKKDFNRTAMNHLVQSLDWYVSVPLMPLEVNHQRRLGKTTYGRPGDYRPKNSTLEYRTPGGFYLRTPLLARSVLGLSLLVTENAVSRLKVISKDFTNLNRLNKKDLQEVLPLPEPHIIRETLLNKSTKRAESHLDAIHKSITGLPTYKKHEGMVENFFREVEEKREPNPNLVENWKGTQ